MSNSNGKTEDENVVLVTKTTELPYLYIPYSSIERARINHPDDKLYLFEPGKPAGWRIVAFPVLMTKPETEEEEEEVISALRGTKEEETND